MLGLLAVPLSEIKSCCVTVFLHKNDERTTSSGLQFKTQYQKKACFLFGENWTCLSRAGRESSPSPSPPWLHACIFFLYQPLAPIYLVNIVSFFSLRNLHKGVFIILFTLHLTIFVLIIFSRDAKVSVSVSTLGSLFLIHFQVFLPSSGTWRTDWAYSFFSPSIQIFICLSCLN